MTNYTLHGKNIVHLTQGSNELHFWYDAQNRPAIVEWNNGVTTAKYAYIQNLHGDIVGIIDSNGTEVVKYIYDAWGKVLSTTGSLTATLGTVQPFRYRGYVFDVETGFYYLRSRYYNPTWGRFINADVLIQTNLFWYCRNCPVNRFDENGCDSNNTTNLPKSTIPFPKIYYAYLRNVDEIYNGLTYYEHNELDLIYHLSFTPGTKVEVFEYEGYFDLVIFIGYGQEKAGPNKWELCIGATENKNLIAEDDETGKREVIFGKRTFFNEHSDKADMIFDYLLKYYIHNKISYPKSIPNKSNFSVIVEDFQRINNLTIDGKVGTETMSCYLSWLYTNVAPYNGEKPW